MLTYRWSPQPKMTILTEGSARDIYFWLILSTIILFSVSSYPDWILKQEATNLVLNGAIDIWILSWKGIVRICVPREW